MYLKDFLESFDVLTSTIALLVSKIKIGPRSTKNVIQMFFLFATIFIVFSKFFYQSITIFKKNLTY